MEIVVERISQDEARLKTLLAIGRPQIKFLGYRDSKNARNKGSVFCAQKIKKQQIRNLRQRLSSFISALRALWDGCKMTEMELTSFECEGYYL